MCSEEQWSELQTSPHTQEIPLLSNDFAIPFKRLQFPVKLCFAITINKAQGQPTKKFTKFANQRKKVPNQGKELAWLNANALTEELATDALLLTALLEITNKIHK